MFPKISATIKVPMSFVYGAKRPVYGTDSVVCLWSKRFEQLQNHSESDVSEILLELQIFTWPQCLTDE